MGKWLFLVILTMGIEVAESQESPGRFTWTKVGTERGLVHPRVNSLVIDQNGFLWVGTFMGLNRFDGHQFKTWRHNPQDEKSLSHDYIRHLFVDKVNNLWVGLDNGHINRFNPENESFEHFNIGTDNAAENRKSVKTITQDFSGTIWVACIEGLFRINPDTKDMQSYTNPVFPGTTGTLETLYIDALGRFWVSFWGGGLFLFDPVQGSFTRFFTQTDDPLQRACIMDIKEDSQHNLWLGTYNLGLLRISHPGQAITVFGHNSHNPNSLNSNRIKALEIVNDNQIWIGTEEGGLDLFEPLTGRFHHFFSGFQTSHSVEGESFYDIVKDGSGRLWLGSRDNGLFYFNANENPFQHIYKSSIGISDNNLVISALCEDHEQNIWAGIKGDLALVDTDRNLLFPQKLDLHESPNAAACDPNGNIWIGGLKGGIYKFSPKNKTLKAFHYPEIANIKVISFHFNENQVFIGLEGQFATINTLGEGFQLINNPNTKGPFSILPEDSLHYFFMRRSISVFNGEPSASPAYQAVKVVDYQFPNSKTAALNKEYLFCGTDAGLFLINKVYYNVKFIEKLPGGISYSVKSLQAENNGTIWFSTNNNLVRYTPSTGYIRIFDRFDGLPDLAFRDAVGCKTSDGRIVMGGENGLVVFNPLHIRQVNKTPGIEISSLTPGRRNHQGLSIPALAYTSAMRPVKLRYNQNYFVINWAMPEFIQPNKVLYTWKLEGFDKEWNLAYNERSATYMNLPWGEYTFHVRAKDTENNWSDTKTIKIHIAPPPWLSWYAYLVYFLIVFVMLYYYRLFNIRKERLNHDLKLQKLKMENIEQLLKKEHELNELKFSFFTNISHEFKTPLTLIISPLEQYLESGRKLTDVTIRQIHGNAQRLYQLITQILDFRKMESGKLTMNYSFDNLAQFTVNICNHFKQSATQKSLAFETIVHEDSIYTSFDADKMEKILYNLLSNAIKFTRKGKIRVEIGLKTTIEDEKAKQHAEIIIKDTGVGIPNDALPHIFDRFFQVRQQDGKTQGTGIGLALVQEMVRMHNGKISVISEVGEGTTFQIVVPVIPDEDKAIDKVEARSTGEIPVADEGIEIGKECPETGPSGKPDRYTVLIAEDNTEMRSYLARELLEDYEIIEAADGEEAFDRCRRYHPDLVLSDILMPGTDGLEFCRQVRNDEKTSHIPMLMVTALSSAQYQEQAYRLGADDYITKPFNINILKEKIKNFISSRESLKRQFIQNAFSEPSVLKIASNDEKFLLKTHKVIEENLSDSEFDIDHFAREMATSRTQLYRKLKALTGVSASEYIKVTRLKIAARMISEKNFNISEAAYLVGFKDPKYFSKCFQKQFGIIPSRYKQETNISQVES